ncbi:Protease production enhancer protein [Ruegeria denitrificans]|uniref:Protease production enhancer protein n=1 Tax=Ruegeria denitrificans TaxID=1715692 RepID=A0A0P1IQA6_9RHOB|nr:response regulator transcription factor [Ruegeria denitrificans]CUK17776.1 Protease production enhancer protein [Ruegeria denitrificans]
MVDTPGAPVDVMLADSNPLVLSAMSEIFERDSRFSLMATSSTAEGFLGTVMRAPVQVGVIDWNLPVLGAAKLIEVLREQANAPRLVVYGDATGDIPRLAMQPGAAGFAARSGEVEGLLETCANLAAGKMVFPFVDVRKMQQDPIQTLSRKERAILEALAQGMSNRDLSKELQISTNTVKFHMSNIYEKLNVKNRTQAIAQFYSSRIAGE